MPKGKKKLVLIDGNALIHRAFHAFARADLRTPKGEPTTAVYGFAVMLLNIYTKLKPDYVAVAFDTGKPTFRHEEYEEYKATRVASPKELYDKIS
jgi:DNA polymerase-1